jgi:PTH2 family peptidyl-tRNA hydrolase
MLKWRELQMMNMSANTKQIIVVRRDLKMKHGKMAAQVAHAAMSFLTREGRVGWQADMLNDVFMNDDESIDRHNGAIRDWLANSFTKVVLGVDSEEELREILAKAEESDVMAHLVVDNGRTVFNNIPTPTCLALGPDWNDALDELVEHLKLY